MPGAVIITAIAIIKTGTKINYEVPPLAGLFNFYSFNIIPNGKI